MRILLARISLLRFFKIFQKYVSYAFLYTSWLVRFCGYLFN